MEGPLVPGAPNGSMRSPSPTPPLIDPQVIVDHLEKVLDVSLGASETDLYAPGSLLSPAKLQDTLQRCSRFASEGQSALYLVKDRAEEPRADALDGTNGRCPPKTEVATRLTPHRRHPTLHLHYLDRAHGFSYLCRICCHFEAPDTHRSSDTP